MAIDPNFDNFIIEKDTKKIIIIDTEHWPTLFSITHRPVITSWSSFALYGVKHFFHNVFMSTSDLSGTPFDQK